MASGLIASGLFIACVLYCCINSCNGHSTVTPTVLFATHKDIRMTNGSRSNKFNIIIKDLSEGAALDFYYERGLICWSDSTQELIQCVYSNGTYTGERFTVVNSSLTSGDGLACDWYTGKLYWTDGDRNRIEVISIDNLQRKVLFWSELSQPRAIALAPMYGLFFWTDWGDIPKIERASMDGDPKTREVIVSTEIYWPNGLTVDNENKLIYWADGKLCFIAVMDFHGRNKRKIIQQNLDYPFALTLFDNRIYWTDWKTWCIHSLDLCHTQTYPRELFHGEYIPGDIKIWDAKKQPYGDNPCRHNNGNCSHLCLLSTNKRGYSCACPTGIKMLDDYTCADGFQELLLIVQRTEICQISLDTPDYTSFPLPLTGIKHAIAIDFDPIDRMLYWTDEQAYAIRRAYLNGSNQQDVINTEIANPDGIAIDWVARNLYWTDTGTDRIEVARLNGSSRRVLINEDLVEPRAIAIAPDYGWMFWTDWNEKRPKIERSNLDGSDRIQLVTKDIVWPNGIALDLERKMIYWCDAKTDKIEVSNMDGSNRSELTSHNLPHLFGLSLLGDYLYWTDWQRRSIDRAHKENGFQRKLVIDQVPNVMGLKAVRLNTIPYSNSSCAYNNGGCSHLCFNKPDNKYTCSCQIDYELSNDKHTCIVPIAFLIYTKRDNICRISIENPFTDTIIPVTGVKDAVNLDFDITDKRIYWTDSKLKTITRAFINGSDMERILDLGLETPEAIAFDWVAHNLYWSDTALHRIEMIRLETGSRRILVWQKLIDPKSIVIDPERGYLYWSEWKNKGSIERALLDGTHRQIVLEDIGRANSLTIDYSTRIIYWANLVTSVIESYNLLTQQKNVLISRNVVFPYTVTLYQDQIYWYDWNTGEIERANKFTGENRTIIHNNINSVTNFHVFHPSRKIGTNPCAIANGNCSHLCIALPGPNINSTSTTYKCACPTHYSLAHDNRSCIGPRHFMIYGMRNSIGRFLPDQANDCADIMMRMSGLRNVRGIEFDPITQYIYWIDGRGMSIRRALENQTQQQHIIVISTGGSGSLYDLALDPIGRLLFWTCTTNNVLNVTRLDNGKMLGILVKGDNEKPRNIAIHPRQRLLFWTDLGIDARVMRSKMDGTDRYMIAGELSPNLSALTIDTTTNTVYWGHGKYIESSNLLGGNRKRFDLSSGQVLQLAVFFDYLYWYSDVQVIARTNKTLDDFSKQNVMLHTNRVVIDLIAVKTPENSLMESHVCSPFNNYGGCSHFCIGTDDGITTSPRCSCPGNLVLSDDDRTCRAAPACGNDHFTCAAPSLATVKDCIPVTWKCDGQIDCPDGSDELGCVICDHDQFKCQNHCIDMSFICDGTPQCPDKSDEVHCCKIKQFRCIGSGVCISSSLLCDGWDDCADGSDELPPACLERQKAESRIGGESGKVTYIIVILVVVLATTIIILSYYYCRKRFVGNEDLPDILHDSAGDPLSPKSNSTRLIFMSQKNNRKNGGNNIKVNMDIVRMSMLNGSSIDSSYDRSHITGASSSTRGSSMGGYPQETLNPPPSPATIISSTHCSSSNASRYKPYRYYKNMTTQPPPTPYSTDVCEESDSNYPRQYRYESTRYESEPFPPPPTPRSAYHSDVVTSCPPSPSSRSSTYFSPLPPPPSPVPETSLE